MSQQDQQDPVVAKTNVLIVDDHPIVRQGLRGFIDQEADLEVCGEADDARAAMEAIKQLEPDLAIVDISLKETSGLELIKDIKARYPEVLVLALSMHDESLYAERVLRAGGRGYITKHQATDHIILAIRTVLAGEVYVSDRMKQRIMGKLVGDRHDVGAKAIDRLSDRELEVFELIGRGQSTRQIAEKLFLSVKTIETYRQHIKTKLGLADAAELLQYAIRWVISSGTS